MNGFLNTTYSQVPVSGRDELGFSFSSLFKSTPKVPVSPGSGASMGRSLASTLSTPNYAILPPPPVFNQVRPLLGNPGSGVTMGAGLGGYSSPVDDPLAVLNAANSRGKFETIASLVSQTLAGILPRSTQQVGGQTIQNQTGGGQIYSEEQLYALQQQQLAFQNQNGGNGGAGDVVNQIVNFVTTNPLAVGGVVLAFYLLTKEPPYKRR